MSFAATPRVAASSAGNRSSHPRSRPGVVVVVPSSSRVHDLAKNVVVSASTRSSSFVTLDDASEAERRLNRYHGAMTVRGRGSSGGGCNGSRASSSASFLTRRYKSRRTTSASRTARAAAGGGGGGRGEAQAGEEEAATNSGEAEKEGGNNQQQQKIESGNVPQNIIAGISTACIAIPQSCGYALLAGTGTECAFMSAAAASIPVALLGSSRYMQVGCLALGSLLTFGALSTLGLTPGSATFVMGAATLAFYTGITRLALGFCRLGNLVTSLPKCALEGFVFAAVWMVFASQTPAMLGATCSNGSMSGHFATAAVWLFSHPQVWHPGTAVLTACTFAIMLNGSKIHKMFPSALLCCLLGGGAVAAGVNVGATVGAISLDLGSVFPPALLRVPRELARALLVPGVAIGITTYLEGAAVCKRWADEDGEEWDSNKELVAQGVANVCSAAVGGMPVAGVISRGAFSKTSGATTRLAHGVTGAAIVAFLLCSGGSLLGFLPKAVLGALVGCGVLPLMRPSATLAPLLRPTKTFANLGYEAKRDCLIAWATFFFTVTSAPSLDVGLLKGCLLALAVHLGERAYAARQWFRFRARRRSGGNGFGDDVIVPAAR